MECCALKSLYLSKLPTEDDVSKNQDLKPEPNDHFSSTAASNSVADKSASPSIEALIKENARHFIIFLRQYLDIWEMYTKTDEYF